MPRLTRLLNICGMILVVASLVVTAPPASYAQTSQPDLDPVVDKILTRLENREVKDLRARVRWELSYVIEEDETPDIKLGAIWYKDEKPVPKFKVQFDRKIVGTRSRSLNEIHLFDGRWYVELQSQTKTLTRREVRREDDRVNPYKVGEGPFPLPFGQKKADILAEFEVERVEPKKLDPPKTDHLKLTPRAGTHTGQSYKTVDFWVAREGKEAGLPIKVRVGKKDGTGALNSYITIAFSDVELNPGLDETVFSVDKPAGYEEIVERLETTIEVPTENLTGDKPE